MKLFILCAFVLGAILAHADNSDSNGNNLVATNGSDASSTRTGPIKEPPKLPDSAKSQEMMNNTPKSDDHPRSTLQPEGPAVVKHESPILVAKSSVIKPEATPPVHSEKSDEKIKPVPFEKSDEKTKPLAPEESDEKKKPISSSSALPPNPTTAAIPIDPADNTAGDWNVTEKNLTCIKVHGIISLSITIKNLTHNETFTVNVPPRTKVSGSCDHEYIHWILNPAANETLQFSFAKDNSSTKFYLSRVDGLINSRRLEKPIGFMNNTLEAFVTPVQKSYLCHESVEKHIVHSNVTDIVLTLKDFRIQAFKSSKSNDFDESIDGCPSGSHGTPDVVPIVVGCALALLVVVVLVAYLINRRRSQAHGYLSM